MSHHHAPPLIRPWIARTCAALLLATAPAAAARATQDVLLQTLSGVVVTGVVDDITGNGTLGAHVHDGRFLSNFRSADPGFFSFAYGNVNMPPGASSFPSLHNVNFDLLPMTMGQASSNLYYWNGLDAGALGYTFSDVLFGIPAGVAWEVLDANFAEFAATGSDLVVPGGLIQRTSSDIDPLDGVDSGSMHKHLVLQLDDNDGNSGTSPAAGVYMTSWQIRSVGFETSEPFLMVLGTSALPAAAIDIAAAWADANYDMLTTPVVKGDYDGDADVDGADFLAWQRTLGAAVSPPGQGTDGNVNGAIDGPDLAVWRDHFPTAPPAFAARATVPEPAAATLVLAALSAAGIARRRFSTH